MEVDELADDDERDDRDERAVDFDVVANVDHARLALRDARSA